VRARFITFSECFRQKGSVRVAEWHEAAQGARSLRALVSSSKVWQGKTEELKFIAHSLERSTTAKECLIS
jgi:hypothetical protein